MTPDESTKRLKQVKKIFINNGCPVRSGFYRTNTDLAKEFRSLKISSETESLWRREEFERQFSKIQKISKKDFWKAFFYFTKIMETNEYYLQRMLDLNEALMDKISGQQIVTLLAEIIGDSLTISHDGLIKKCHKLKLHDLKSEFISIAIKLIEKAEKESVLIPFLGENLEDIKLTGENASILKKKLGLYDRIIHKRYYYGNFRRQESYFFDESNLGIYCEFGSSLLMIVSNEIYNKKGILKVINKYTEDYLVYINSVKKGTEISIFSKNGKSVDCHNIADIITKELQSFELNLKYEKVDHIKQRLQDRAAYFTKTN